jgi:hypothetical protein
MPRQIAGQLEHAHVAIGLRDNVGDVGVNAAGPIQIAHGHASFVQVSLVHGNCNVLAREIGKNTSVVPDYLHPRRGCLDDPEEDMSIRASHGLAVGSRGGQSHLPAPR